MAVFYLLLLLVAVVVHGDDRHLICKQVDDLFSGEIPSSTSPSSRTLQGRPGKRGISGEKGDQGDLGPQSPPATVDYAQIQSVVRESLLSDITALSETVDALKQKVSEISRVTKVEKALTTRNCDLFYDGKCFQVILHDEQNVNFAEAQAICRNIGWELANIYGAIHYDMVANYLREKIPSSRADTTAWLGMTIIPQSKEMRYSTERKVSDVGLKWFPGYPTSDSTQTKMGIHIAKDTGSTHEGVHNYPPNYNRYGSICEI